MSKESNYKWSIAYKLSMVIMSVFMIVMYYAIIHYIGSQTLEPDHLSASVYLNVFVISMPFIIAAVIMMFLGILFFMEPGEGNPKWARTLISNN